MKKTIIQVLLYVSLGLFAPSTCIRAQSLSFADIKAQMVADWERAKAYTLEYLNTMPADKYTFKPVDSVRSFAQHMLHLAQFNCSIMSIATDLKMPPWVSSDPQHRSTPQTKDSVLYYVTDSYDFCINAVRSSDTATWGEKKKAHGLELTRFALMNKAFEHQTHHRGQTTVYIRLEGIKPPEERLY